MKKVIALLLAGALVLGASMTCFASPSTEAGTTEQDKIAKEEVTNDFAGVLEEAEIEDEMEDLDIFGIYGSGTLPAAGDDGYIYHTVEVEGLEDGDVAYILAFIDGKWVNVTVEVVDGKITGKFPAAVPYVVITEKDVQTPGTTPGGSPQTGDPGMTMIPVVLAVFAVAAGVAVTTRRRIA